MAQDYIRNLIQKTKEGDKEARQELLQGFTNDIVYRSRLYLGDEASAKAATTDVFMKMLNTLDDALDDESFDEWYQKIIRDVVIRKVIPLTSDGVVRNLPYTKSDEIIDFKKEYSTEDSRRMILKIISELPKAERVVATLYFYEGFSVKEIAQKLYLTEGEVESLLTMAKTKINASGVSLGEFLQMIANIKQTSLKTETLPISAISMGRHARVEDEATAEIEPVEEEAEVIEEEIVEEYEEPTQEDIMAIGNLEETSEIEIEEDNKEPLFFTKHNQLIQEEVVEEIPEDNLDEEIESEGVKVEKKAEVIPVVKKEEYVEKTAEEKRPTRSTQPRKTKKRKVNWLHLLLVMAIGLLILLGLWYLLFKGKGDKTPSNTVVTPEPTQATQPAETEETKEETKEEEKQTENTGGVQGSVEIANDMAINIRTKPSTEGDIVGTVYTSEIYEVFEIKKDDDYTWYRIGDDQWIADGGGWLTYTKK